MLESLLEKILISRLGKYIAGLEKEHLSVAIWKGQILLENAYIRPEALARFRLPLRLALGKISSLRVTIPWRKLASRPVEIELNGLYIVLTPMDSSLWTYDKAAFVQQVRERLELHELRRAQNLSQKLVSAEETLNNKTFLQRLTAKIVDNLRITIKNVHVRFEFRTNLNSFSTGVTLESIDYCTTNSNWESEFTDRQRKGRAGEDIYKLLTCARLGVYFETDESTLLHTEVDETRAMSTMKELIVNPKGVHYVLEPMNLEAQVVHHSDLTDFSRPRYKAAISLPEFQLVYEQKQFHCSVRLAEFLTDYWHFIRLE